MLDEVSAPFTEEDHEMWLKAQRKKVEIMNT